MNNLKEAEKSCRDLLSAFYAIGEKKISVEVEDFLKEANKLKNVIEEGLQNYHVDKMAVKQSHPLAHKPIPDDVYDALPEIPEEQRIVCSPLHGIQKVKHISENGIDIITEWASRSHYLRNYLSNL